MGINHLRQKGKLPKMPPVEADTPRFFDSLLKGRRSLIELKNEVLFSALSYGWKGWTDGALWLVNTMPNVKSNYFDFTDIVVPRDMMLDYYRRYKYISPIPALYCRDISVKLIDMRYKRHFIIYADPERSVAIWRPHVRVIYTTFVNDIFTFWVHPFLNSYTVTIGDDVVAFGIGVNPDCISLGKKALQNAMRTAILQVRCWWERRVQKKYMEKGNPESLFPWRYNVIG